MSAASYSTGRDRNLKDALERLYAEGRIDGWLVDHYDELVAALTEIASGRIDGDFAVSGDMMARAKDALTHD